MQRIAELLRLLFGPPGALKERAGLCRIPGCHEQPTVTLAASDRFAVLACSKHAAVWIESGLARKVACRPRLLTAAVRTWLDVVAEEESQPRPPPET